MIKEYKVAVAFLLKYLLVYVLLNTAYAFFVNSYAPGADPATMLVTSNVTSLLKIADPGVHFEQVSRSSSVPVKKGSEIIIEVYEGCNSINVMIVFTAFLIAFKGPLKETVMFLLTGLLIIYGANLLRVGGLFGIAVFIPDALYFFHKFFFTGILYAIVFLMWFFWVKTVNRWSTTKAS
jgi:exosortase family protein XrtF